MSISVILTVWKRDNLEEQLQAIKNQTADVSDIYVYQNESHVDIEYLKEKYEFKHIHSKDFNFKFHGRFTLPLLFDTEYTAIFDDDTVPNKKWLDQEIIGLQVMRKLSSHFHDKRKILSGFMTLPFHLE